MFLVNRLFGTINSPAPSAELMTIDGGRLFLVRPDSLKAGRECIFLDASLSIRRAGPEHDYQLVVTKAYQEGEEQLLEEDAENSDERVFALDSSLFMSLGPTLDPAAPTPRPISFTWLDPDGDGPDDEFEFVIAGGETESVAQLATDFERLSWRCMWEKQEGQPWPSDPADSEAVESTLEDQFKVERNVPTSTSTTKFQQPLFRAATPDEDSEDDTRPPLPSARKLTAADSESEDELDATGDSDAEDLANQLTHKAVITPAKSRGKGKAPQQRTIEDDIAAPVEKPPTTAAPADTGSTAAFLTVTADLHLYDRATGFFMLQEKDVIASIHRTKGGYWLLVEGAKGPWKETSMVFNFRPESSDADPSPATYTWLLRFTDRAAFDRTQQAVTTALFEGKWGVGAWNKLKEDEQEYQRNAYLDDAEMEDAQEVLDEQPEEEEEEDDDDQDEGDVESDEDERPKFNAAGKKTKNSQLAVGYKDDLSFVVQGDMIGVFKQQRDGGKKLKFVTSIVNLATPDGKKGFTPKKIMLHNQDTSMILQNPLAPGALYRLDLNTGKVVDEYKVSDDIDVTSFLPDAKFAQTTQQQTFIGLSHNSLFRIDPRLSGNKLVDSEFKQYATKNDFSVATTTASGHLAVASNKGDIRLFDKLGKNAKTALPALGDPILGIDVTADGRYVLATCKTYLLLIDTQIPDGAGRYAGSLGFERSFPASEKPTPKKLQLRPEHVAHMQEQSREGVSFTPAKFNAGLDSTERTIVTSSGPYIVAWNFRHVKQGVTNQYTIRRFSENIVADQFRFGGDREIIVTLPDDVFVEEKKKLKAPTRESISNIVNSYYD
ncbi:Vacuolar import and degradation protein 27 [Microbotryomycetes sp. JL221]|nr:Vacuolar import and degradation protein 27 [Microbotryomycetes sp. JL221]